MALNNSLARILDPAPLLMTVRGVKQVFKSNLGVENFSLQFHNNWKQGLRASKPDKTDYPHGGFKMTAINVTENNLKNMLRVGTGDGVVAMGQNNALLKRSFLIPVVINCECEIKFQDVQEAMAFSTASSIFFAGGLMNFSVEYARNKWTGEVRLSGNSHSMPFPYIDDLNEGSTPGTAGVQFSLDIATKVGFVRDISKINNYGAITFNVDASAEPSAEDIAELNAVANEPQFVISEEDAAQLQAMSVVERLMRGK